MNDDLCQCSIATGMDLCLFVSIWYLYPLTDANLHSNTSVCKCGLGVKFITMIIPLTICKCDFSSIECSIHFFANGRQWSQITHEYYKQHAKLQDTPNNITVSGHLLLVGSTIKNKLATSVFYVYEYLIQSLSIF